MGRVVDGGPAPFAAIAVKDAPTLAEGDDDHAILAQTIIKPPGTAATEGQPAGSTTSTT